MVESIGSLPVISRDVGVARVAAVAPVAAAAAATQSASAKTATTGADTASLDNVAKSLSVSAPVDMERVATIKKAIADGKFPLLPATIADRLLALKLEWNPND